MEASSLPDTEFKTMVISENSIKNDMESIKKEPVSNEGYTN